MSHFFDFRRDFFYHELKPGERKKLCRLIKSLLATNIKLSQRREVGGEVDK